jgi:hypothetical protein
LAFGVAQPIDAECGRHLEGIHKLGQESPSLGMMIACQWSGMKT